MKRIILSVAMLLAALQFYGQDYTESVRFSQTTPDGDARYTALGGAMSALGANFTALRANPAGLGVFRKSSYEVTLQAQFDYSKATYLDNSTIGFSPNLNISNAGWAGVLEGPDDQPLKFVAFGISYNREQSFLSRAKYSGINTNSSMIDDFTGIAVDNIGTEVDGVPMPGSNYTDFAYLNYMIDPYYNENDELVAYTSDYIGVNDGTGEFEFFDLEQQQSYHVYESGRRSNTSFTVAANIEDKFFIGGNLNYSRIRFERSYNYLEANLNGVGILNEFTFDRNLTILGDGFSADVGFIYVPAYPIRLSAAYKSPVLYYMSEDFSAEMETEYVRPPASDNEQTKYKSRAVSSANYSFISPQQFNLGAAFVFGKAGFISLDYENKDFSNSLYSSDDFMDGLSDLNKQIDTSLSVQHAIKLGGELKVYEYWALRAGFAAYTSPYNASDFEIDTKSFSLGFGFRADGFYSDVAYQLVSKNRTDVIYQDWDYNDVSGSADESLHKLMVTVGFYF